MLHCVQVLSEEEARKLGPGALHNIMQAMLAELKALLACQGHPAIVTLLDPVRADDNQQWVGYGMPVMKGLGTVFKLFQRCAPHSNCFEKSLCLLLQLTQAIWTGQLVLQVNCQALSIPDHQP